MIKSSLKFCGLIWLAAVPCTSVFGDTKIDFENATVGQQFSNDVVGGEAGPFMIDTDMATFTTSSLSGGFLEATSFGLGINSGGGDPDTESFNVGEEWGFTSSIDLLMVAFDIGGLQTEETFDVRSDAWINLTSVTTGNGVSFEAATGTFTVTDGPASDIFTLAELTGGRVLPVFAGTEVVFGNLTSSFGPNDDVELQSITFRAVPEPTSVFVFIPLAVACATRRRK